MTTKKKKTRKASANEREIATLARGAAKAGNRKLVKLCGRALAGSAAARRECVKYMHAARAMRLGESRREEKK